MGLVLESNWLWAVIIYCNCNRSANKSNHLVQKPLLFVTQPLIRDSIYDIWKEVCNEGEQYQPGIYENEMQNMNEG
jgi:hypothetical protein